MHITTVTMKDGRVLSNPLELFRPKDGYLKLFEVDELLYFKDMESAITAGERLSATKIGDDDEIERARRYMRVCRQMAMDGLSLRTPLQEWETP